MTLPDISKNLVDSMRMLRFAAPVTHVYNPLEYAWAPHVRYLETYGRGRKEVLLVGMNPGPFGMAQTGVPFGEVSMVRDWMGICEPVERPRHEHPKRPVQGFACARSEVSGARLWGWARDACGSPERFFERFFVVNYCPLCFLEASGRNRTPDKLLRSERDAVSVVCNEALRQVVTQAHPQYVLGVGAFAEARIREALGGDGAVIGRIPHPSPANPVANRGWAAAATKALAGYGISL